MLHQNFREKSVKTTERFKPIKRIVNHIALKNAPSLVKVMLKVTIKLRLLRQ